MSYDILSKHRKRVCTTNCDAYARGICPFGGESDKLNRCTRIKNYIEEVEDGKNN